MLAEPRCSRKQRRSRRAANGCADCGHAETGRALQAAEDAGVWRTARNEEQNKIVQTRGSCEAYCWRLERRRLDVFRVRAAIDEAAHFSLAKLRSARGQVPIDDQH